MRASGPKGWFLDLANTSDEVLLLLAREAASVPARDELTCRYWHQFGRSVRGSHVGKRLTAWEQEDAQQQAFFWIQEAILVYDLTQLSIAQGSSFRTFLQRVFRARLADFRRSLGRRKKRFCALTEPDHWLADLPRDTLYQRTESLGGQLAEALTLLDPPARALWNALLQGKRLCDLPAVLAVSYRTVKRRWRKLRLQLMSAFCRIAQRRAAGRDRPGHFPRTSHVPSADENVLSPFEKGGE
jgi:DNA-directed RNA polymerase specialized sigma24 family protein